MIYLASPYSHPDPIVREIRYLEAMKKLLWYVKAGVACFSPIVHSHEMAKIYNMGRDALTWSAYNEAMLRDSEELHILTLPGWKESVGIMAEKDLALSLELGIVLVDPVPEVTHG